MKLAKRPFPSPYFYLFYCDSSIIIEIIIVRDIKECFDSKVDNMTKAAYPIMAGIVLLWKL
jgi:retron-type reverse transcriptase